jgi:hypothetical protein
MIHRLISATHVHDYVIHLRFADGTEGDIDLSGELDGEIFHPLQDPAYFCQFRLDADLHTLVWPNGADFAPEFLYERIRIAA